MQNRRSNPANSNATHYTVPVLVGLWLAAIAIVAPLFGTKVTLGWVLAGVACQIGYALIVGLHTPHPQPVPARQPAYKRSVR